MQSVYVDADHACHLGLGLEGIAEERYVEWSSDVVVSIHTRSLGTCLCEAALYDLFTPKMLKPPHSRKGEEGKAKM